MTYSSNKEYDGLRGLTVSIGKPEFCDECFNHPCDGASLLLRKTDEVQ